MVLHWMKYHEFFKTYQDECRIYLDEYDKTDTEHILWLIKLRTLNKNIIKDSLCL